MPWTGPRRPSSPAHPFPCRRPGRRRLGDRFRLYLPADLRSGVYAARLQRRRERVLGAFFVRPPPGAAPAPIACLAATATYWAYMNNRGRFTSLATELYQARLLVIERRRRPPARVPRGPASRPCRPPFQQQRRLLLFPPASSDKRQARQTASYRTSTSTCFSSSTGSSGCDDRLRRGHLEDLRWEGLDLVVAALRHRADRRPIPGSDSLAIAQGASTPACATAGRLMFFRDDVFCSRIADFPFRRAGRRGSPRAEAASARRTPSQAFASALPARLQRPLAPPGQRARDEGSATAPSARAPTSAGATDAHPRAWVST